MNILDPLAFKRKFRWGFEVLQDGKVFIPLRWAKVDVENYEFNSDKLELERWFTEDNYLENITDTEVWTVLAKMYGALETKVDLNLIGNLILYDGCGNEVKKYVFEGLKLDKIVWGDDYGGGEYDVSSTFSFSKVDCIISENNTTIFP